MLSGKSFIAKRIQSLWSSFILHATTMSYVLLVLNAKDIKRAFSCYNLNLFNFVIVITISKCVCVSVFVCLCVWRGRRSNWTELQTSITLTGEGVNLNMDVGGQGFRGSKNVFLHVINWWPNKAEKVSESCFVLLIFLICVTDYFSDAEELMMTKVSKVQKKNQQIFWSVTDNPTTKYSAVKTSRYYCSNAEV